MEVDNIIYENLRLRANNEWGGCEGWTHGFFINDNELIVYVRIYNEYMPLDYRYKTKNIIINDYLDIDNNIMQATIDILKTYFPGKEGEIVQYNV